MSNVVYFADYFGEAYFQQDYFALVNYYYETPTIPPGIQVNFTLYVCQSLNFTLQVVSL